MKRIRTDVRPAGGGLTRGVRDTGITVGSRKPYERKRSATPVVILIVVALVVGLTAATMAARNDPGVTTVAVGGQEAFEAIATPDRDPTPFFASYRSLQIRLPIDPSAVTALAFHQASGKKALHMTSLVPDADMKRAAEIKAVPPFEPDEDLPDTVWPGTCLRLWRSNRSGQPDTAADVGADAGTAVYAPVSGTVLQVKTYRLYDKYDDCEIHLQPDGWDDVDVVLIHIDGVQIAPGDRVVAGVTQIATVRKMSDKIEIQLGGYTPNGGDHVHVQLNKVDVPGVYEPPDES
jgi:murein DD-endopeptidase MepM/ murein hydrolase activator NlpD